MSINHFSSDLPETLWWQQQQQQYQSTMEPTQNTPPSKHHNAPTPPQNSPWTSHTYHQHHHHHHHHQQWLNTYNSEESPSMFPTQNPTLHFNLNQEDDEEELEDQITTNIQQEPQQVELEKEPMFEKHLTPSDVGKLNRLVIPKQHAEKYFPLGGDSGDKGLLLSFEDESGKCWRFRYSYWNSSQSYVLTKGWSRYVKEKRLDAGDIVLFERLRTDSDRLFIGWRRRGAAVAQDGSTMVAHSGGWSNGLYSGHPYPSRPVQGHGFTVPYQPDCLHAGTVLKTTPAGNSKTLRLFGVNMECRLDESEPSTPDGPSLSSQDPVHQHSYSQAYYSNSNSHMDITFSGDVNQMRNRRG